MSFDGLKFGNVLKFGGTSVADYDAMKRCASIIAQNTDNKLVVVSASAGVTDLLSQLGNCIQDEAERRALIAQIKDIEDAILVKLSSAHQDHLRPTIDATLDKITSLAATLADHGKNPILRDSLLATGEQMSSQIMRSVLVENGVRAGWLDATHFMRTNEDFGKAEVNTTYLKNTLASTMDFNQMDVYVTQGFIGGTEEGQTTTLGRGGSDYSAALMAEGLEAKSLQIWTDVPGLYTTDPRIVPDARPIGEISFPEAAEMATFGAKILHPKTLWPAVRSNIPVFVGSSRHPEQGGTEICPTEKCSQADQTRLTAIALRQDQVLITLTSLDMLHSFGFLARAFQVLADYKVSVDLVTTSEVSVALTLDDPDRKGHHIPKGLLEELEKLGDVTVTRDLALIALIGNGISAAAGVSAKVFQTINDIPIRLICQGASQHNLCFLVDQTNAATAVKRIHDTLFQMGLKEQN